MTHTIKRAAVRQESDCVRLTVLCDSQQQARKLAEILIFKLSTAKRTGDAITITLRLAAGDVAKATAI